MFHLETLGVLDLRNSGGESVRRLLTQPKRAALLVYLATHRPGCFHRRDALLPIFWPESDEPSARHALSQALYVLRGTLGDDAIETRGSDEIRLREGSVSCDAVALRAAVADGRWADALDLYHGDFLEALHVLVAEGFEWWTDEQRTDLRSAAAHAAWSLALEQASRGNGADAERTAIRAVRLAPADEQSARQTIAAIAASGDAGAALRVFEALRASLANSFELDPAAETWELATALRARRSAEGAPAPALDVDERDDASALTEAVHARRRPRLLATVGGAGLLLAIAGILAAVDERADSTPTRVAAMPGIAVLPFTALPDSGIAFGLAMRLHDELLTQLSRVGSVRVISRASVLPYGGGAPTRAQIARDLGVDNVVEASVQANGDRTHIGVRLVDARSGTILWADTYEPPTADAFSVVPAATRHIIASLGAVLTDEETLAIVRMPTANPAAYRYYLQGREYFGRALWRGEEWAAAEELFERAIGIDSTFALAHAGLSEVNGMTFWLGYDRSPARLERQLQAAETSLRLEPEAPEALRAMGLALYTGRQDWEGARDYFMKALARLPNDADLWERLGWTQRRLGDWSGVLLSFENASRLNPRNAKVFDDLAGNTLLVLHRYPEAIQNYDQALSIAPDFHGARIRKGWAYALWQGQLDSLDALLDQIPTDERHAARGSRTANRVRLMLWRGDAHALLDTLDRASESVFEGQEFLVPKSLYRAWALELVGERAAATAAFRAATELLDSIVSERPDDWRARSARGLALAGAGRTREAVAEADWLARSNAAPRDALWGPLIDQNRAAILVQAGDLDSAARILRPLITDASWLSVHSLRLDPVWAPLRASDHFDRITVGSHRAR